MSESEQLTFTNAKFGEVTIEKSSIVTFPSGVPGFERCKDFGLVSVDDEAPFMRLLSTEKPALGFVILNPTLIWHDYDPQLSSDELEGLEIESPDDLEIYCIVTLSPIPQDVTANLKGPIAVNTRTMTARQMILMDDRYHTKHSLLAANEGAASKEEATQSQ